MPCGFHELGGLKKCLKSQKMMVLIQCFIRSLLKYEHIYILYVLFVYFEARYLCCCVSFFVLSD